MKFTGILLVMVLGANASGQETTPLMPRHHGETISLFTDRSFYVTGEEVALSAFYEKPESAGEEPWSTVLYTELIRWDGTKLARGKFPIANGRARGVLTIPSNLISGNYYLRAYTRWMRNFDPLSYTYKTLTVLNPEKTEVDKGPENGEDPATIDRRISYREIPFRLSGLQERYESRSRAEMEIEFPEQFSRQSFTLSITRKTPHGSPDASIRFIPETNRDTTEPVTYYPEINGLTVSGKVIGEQDREPVEGVKVDLSSFSDSFYYYAMLSDENGAFYFTLPAMRGTHEFHISVERDSGPKNEILVENQYCTKSVTLPWIPFQLDKEDRTRAEVLALNAQLQQRFARTGDDGDSLDYDPGTFYGRPSSTVYVEEYIELTDLREFFFELVRDVSIGYTRREPDRLEVNSTGSLQFFPPLVLMDNIPVANDKRLLRIPSRRIEYIEVVNKGYVLGDFKHSGVISIFSKNNDMAGLQTDRGSYFFEYTLFGKDKISLPYRGGEAGSRTPLRSNLLCWDPALEIPSGSPVPVSFTTPDAPGTYVVRIQGLNDRGQPIRWEQSFRVE